MPPHRLPLLLLASLAVVAAPSIPAADFLSTSGFQPANSAAWSVQDGHTFVELKGTETATAVFIVPAGGAGFYAVTDSRIRRDAAVAGRMSLGLRVTSAGGRSHEGPPPAVQTAVEAGELFEFDAFLGYLDEGDTVQLSLGAGDDGPAGDRAELDGRVTRLPFLPVSVFPEDIRDPVLLRAPGAWSLAKNVAAASPAARELAWGQAGDHGFTFVASALRTVPGAAGHESLAAFRVPQSGYYALHDAWFAAQGVAVEARLFVGDEAAPRRVVPAAPAGGRTRLNFDLGYLPKGEVVWLALAGSGGTVDLAGSIVEWAPRRAPLRVQRGPDGLLDVLEPEAPRTAVDIPAARWITVPAGEGDRTQAVREAFAQAAALARDGGYAGVRLAPGATYAVATKQDRGRVFDLRGIERVIFDGNHATLHIGSPELARLELQLFHVTNCRNLAFADFTATGATIPFTTGLILDVTPRGEKEMTQTVTFRVDPGELDPLKDIARNGRTNAYAYDPQIPGRLGVGTWTHYPATGNPSIKATAEPGVFTHTVTRTNNSIEPGMKWLIKNKNAGVIYLETRGNTENITLSGVDGRAAGGGQLRFWQTSGINILDSRFEPDGDNWISSSADGVHGRGREGVWLENTLIRGICEDIMNTYGQNMVVGADDNPDDNVMTIRMFNRSAESFNDGAMPMPTPENVVAGDQLVFFNPKTGRVLGYAGVVAIANGRFTLTNPVPGVDTWEEGDGRGATMVYNTRVAGRFFVRDTRLMDSMRFGIYIKARGGVIFGTQFEGLSGPSVLGMNEPEWPEGPPPTHIWVQGCTFSQNNYGFMPRNRDYVVVDPADISIYTRHFRDPAVPDDHRAFITHGQYANSHVKLLGNVFRDWRGMGISVRNAKNVRIEDNLFLAPVDDAVTRRTLADDSLLRGDYAAIHLDSIGGVRVTGNRFHGLPAGDRTIAQGTDVIGVTAADNVSAAPVTGATVALSFDEWFGATSAEAAGIGKAADRASLGGATHRAGRFGAGLHFAGDGAPAVVAGSGDSQAGTFAIALWVRASGPATRNQVALKRGDARSGLLVAAANGRWFVSAWSGAPAPQIDLGPVVADSWQHFAISYDAATQTLRAFRDGLEVAAAKLPAKAAGEITLGGAKTDTLEAFQGDLDEFYFFPRTITAADLVPLVLRRLP